MFKYSHMIKQIKSKKEFYRRMSDAELSSMTPKLKYELRKGKKEDGIIADAFAIAGEAAYRILGMYPYDVQFMAGIALCKGNIAQMKTGEGKTLVAVLPSYLHALSNKGVHVITCNDYLANRDAQEMGEIHRFLGLSVGCVTHDIDRIQRKKEYACDITYVTNSELGFDYLRDNLANDKKDIVLRGLHCCIIDEADSILIDEARTPLVISGANGKSDLFYFVADAFAKEIKKGEIIGKDTKIAKLNGSFAETTGDFIINEESKQIRLTTEGLRKAERFFGVDNIASPENLDKRHYIDMALKANYIMKKDVDYIVDDEKVKLVDKFTGRVLDGRRYSDGLHQALEAKEGVEILKESKTYASITYQTFFNKFDIKCGMTGTIGNDKKEIKQTYGMNTVIIPTNKKVIRKDRKDLMFVTKESKYRAIVNEIKWACKKGQPVLIGTGSIEDSEILSRYLNESKIKHNVLNAKKHEYEAKIIANAGKFGAVTIATNMAGRGTDIKLDKDAKAAGGLKVIGTERFESKRIDDQLIGRSGRQGDPGESFFFLSLEDDMLRIYGEEKRLKFLKSKAKRNHVPLRGIRIHSFVKNAQDNIEGSNYMARKNVADYDRILSEQRDMIYDERKRILNMDDPDELIKSVFRKTALYSAKSIEINGGDYESLYREFSSLVPVSYYSEELNGLSVNNLEEHFYKDMMKIFEKMKAGVYKDQNRRANMIRQMALRIIDSNWIHHLESLEQLRQGVALQAYAQTDPKYEYAINAYQMFDEMLVYDTLLITKTLMKNAISAEKRRIRNDYSVGIKAG